jgi:hypothetical protein
VVTSANVKMRMEDRACTGSQGSNPIDAGTQRHLVASQSDPEAQFLSKFLTSLSST